MARMKVESRLQRVRHAAPEVGRPVRRLRRVELVGRGGRAPPRAAADRRRPRRRACSATSIRWRAGPGPTGIGELDRVLGGGIVPGSVTLLGGEPGIGKSTLLLQLLASWRGPRAVRHGRGERAAGAPARRAARRGAPDLWLLAETSLPHDRRRHRRGAARRSSSSTRSRPCTIRCSARRPARWCRCAGAPTSSWRSPSSATLPVVLVGHVTKEGSLAGPRVLEHVVDTVLAFEGERHHALRLLRATKHRFGPTNELGLFEMAGHGLVGVPDPSHLFLGDRRTGVPGSAVAPTMEGQRPLLVEVQALTMGAPPGVPARRTTQGIDGNRLALLLAVLQQRAGVPTQVHDVYASAVGRRAVGRARARSRAVSRGRERDHRPPVAERPRRLRRGRPGRRTAPGRARAATVERGRAPRLQTCDRPALGARARDKGHAARESGDVAGSARRCGLIH